MQYKKHIESVDTPATVRFCTNSGVRNGREEIYIVMYWTRHKAGFSGGRGGGGVLAIMHDRSRMPKVSHILTTPGQSMSSFQRPGRHCLHQVAGDGGGLQPFSTWWRSSYRISAENWATFTTCLVQRLRQYGRNIPRTWAYVTRKPSTSQKRRRTIPLR